MRPHGFSKSACGLGKMGTLANEESYRYGVQFSVKEAHMDAGVRSKVLLAGIDKRNANTGCYVLAEYLGDRALHHNTDLFGQVITLQQALDGLGGIRFLVLPDEGILGQVAHADVFLPHQWMRSGGYQHELEFEQIFVF